MSPLAKPRRTITRTLHASPNHFCGHRLAVGDQSEKGHQVDEERGGVDGPAVLAGGVIRREHVVVVVESLAAGADRDDGVFAWVDMSVVRPVAPQMRDTVDSPRYVQDGDVAQDSTRQESRPRTLGPVVDRHDRWKDETQQNQWRHVQPVHNR